MSHNSERANGFGQLIPLNMIKITDLLKTEPIQLCTKRPALISLFTYFKISRLDL